MSIKVLSEETVEYSIYAVKSVPDEEIELNDDCKRASGFTDKAVAIGYAVCLAENFDFTDLFIVESRTTNNYWSKDDAVKQEKIVWSCIKFDDDKSENDFEDVEITEETEELVDIDE